MLLKQQIDYTPASTEPWMVLSPGLIVIRFSYPVELPTIQSAISVVIFEDELGRDRKDADIKAIVQQCITRDTNLYDDDDVSMASLKILLPSDHWEH